MLTISFQLNIKESELFRGVRNSYIYFLPNEADGQDRNGNWVIQSEMSPSYQLILGKDESQGYPFGRFDWRLGSNTSFCSRPPGGILG